MTENQTAPKKRGRPKKQPDETAAETTVTLAEPERATAKRPAMIPAAPSADPKSLAMMDWIFTYLPREMARNFYGKDHTPRS